MNFKFSEVEVYKMSAKKLTLEEQKEIEIYVLKVRDKYLEEENKKE